MGKRNQIEWFGVKISTTKDLKISLESFLKPTYTVSTESFFDYVSFNNYKYFHVSNLIWYYDHIIDEFKNHKDHFNPRMKLDTRLATAERILDYLKHTNEEERIERIKEYYDKYTNKDISFEEYLQRQNINEDLLYSHYDFSTSFLGNKYSDKFFEDKKQEMIYNFQLNMNHFRSLSSDEFNICLNKFIRYHHNFQQVKNLNKILHKPGYYLLVLDEYKQVYIGVSYNVGDRILEHWKRIKQYDRRIFGTYKTSKLSIDSFGPLDTTRIYVSIDPSANDYDLSKEDKYINYFPNKFVANRTEGGELPFGPVIAKER